MPERALRPSREEGADEEGPHSPEGLVISALLGTGMFTPEAYRLTDEHLACYQQLWRFCADYQQRSGEAPPLNLIAQRYPDFKPVPNVDPGWAADQLHQAHSRRRLRTQIGQALDALRHEDLREAVTALSDIHLPRSMSVEPTSIFDHKLLEEQEAALTIDVPYHKLSMVAGGMRSSELWYLAGRPGVGKSNIATAYMDSATKAGFRGQWITLEMPKRDVARRLWRTLAGRDAVLRRRLMSEDTFEVKEAMDELADRLPVIPTVTDRSDGPVTLETVREAMIANDYVILDHVGLLKSAAGTRMAEDSRIMGVTSNQLREDTLTTGGTVLALCHTNRESDSRVRAPKLSELAESDWLGRDGNVVVTMSRYSDSVMLHSAEKVREGPGARWMSRYDPANGRFNDIKRDTAEELRLIDDERKEDG